MVLRLIIAEETGTLYVALFCATVDILGMILAAKNDEHGARTTVAETGPLRLFDC
jgi:hypothetical protein